MSNLAEKKNARSIQKRKVTKGIGKLKSSLVYCSDSKELQQRAESLESDFDILVDLHEDCVESGAEDAADYMREITSTFEEVMKCYFDFSKAEKEKTLLQEASPLKKNIDRDFMRIETVMDRIHDSLGKELENTNDSLILELSEDTELMSSILNALLTSVSELGKLTEDAELTLKVSKLILKTDQIHRDSKVFIKRFTMKKMTNETSTSEGTPHTALSPSLNPKASEFSPNSSLKSSTNMSTTRENSSSQVLCSEVAGSDASNNQVTGNSLSHLTIASNQSTFQRQEASSHMQSHDHNPSHGNNYHNILDHETVHTKRPSLPIFSGRRSDWPEFRAVWKSLAEIQFKNKLQLAMELKRCCRGNAAERVKHIYVTHDQAYEDLWARLEEEYDDAGLSVQAALDQLITIKPVAIGDHRSLVAFVDTIEGIHNQLQELHQLDAIHTADVDRVNRLLPREVSTNWLRMYRDLKPEEKLRPFPAFMRFLKTERAIVARLVDHTHPSRRKEKPADKRIAGSHNTTVEPSGTAGSHQYKKPTANGCVYHKGATHPTELCKVFMQMSVSQKYEELKKSNRCFMCLKSHRKGECTAKPCTCGKRHHAMLCTKSKDKNQDQGAPGIQSQSNNEEHEPKKSSFLIDKGCDALYPINTVPVDGTNRFITVFSDAGSNASYITEACASKLSLKRIKKVTLEVAVVGGEQKEYPSTIFEIPLSTKSGKVVKVKA